MRLKKHLLPAIFGCALLVGQITLAASTVDEESSPYKWGHWNKMTAPAAGSDPGVAGGITPLENPPIEPATFKTIPVPTPPAHPPPLRKHIPKPPPNPIPKPFGIDRGVSTPGPAIP